LKLLLEHQHLQCIRGHLFFGDVDRGQAGSNHLGQSYIVNRNYGDILGYAKAMVMQMDSDGYVPPIREKSIYALGERGMAYLMQFAQSMVWSGYITEHDKHVADKLAYVLSGGPLSSPQWVNESYILDLEREAFLSLCGEEKTRARIQHMLRTGKPLRN